MCGITQVTTERDLPWGLVQLLAVLNGSSTWGTQVVQDSDNGSADNNWRLVQVG